MTEKLQEGTKYDGRKTRLDLVPVYPLWAVAEVYTFGADKYEDDNWRKGIKWSRIFGAAMRHLWKFWSGEDLDDESGLPHLAHAAWSCMTLLEYTRNKRDYDNRPKGAKYSETEVPTSALKPPQAKLALTHDCQEAGCTTVTAVADATGYPN